MIKDDQKEAFLANMAISEALVSRFSSFHKAKRVLSWVIRWLVKSRVGIRATPSQGSGQVVSRLRGQLEARRAAEPSFELSGGLEPEELQAAHLLFIRGA